jgi:hypothetical protein
MQEASEIERHVISPERAAVLFKNTGPCRLTAVPFITDRWTDSSR